MDSVVTITHRLDWAPLLVALGLLVMVLFVRSAPVRASDIYTSSLPALGESMRQVDGINTFRGADMLVVYTGANGQTTGTNQWGTEAVIEAGRVVRVGGNNLPIPQDGLVVSAHGAAIPWLQENLPLGAKVELSGRQLHAHIDAETHVIIAHHALQHTEAALDDSWDMLPRTSQDRATELLEQAAGSLEQEQFAQAIALAAEARFYATASFPIEVRGVWHRPVERSPEEIQKTLDQLADAGFNALFLESFYTGYAIYPSAVAPQNPQFLGWDPLRVWADEAASRGIELHLWTHLFHLGRVTIDRHILWTNLQRDGSIGATLEPGLYYGDPGHPEVRDYVFRVLQEMVERYPVAGLHLDYVRYPNTSDLGNTSGYSPTSRKLFQEATGFDPMEISPTTHPSEWAQWLAWQEQNITGFVERVHTWREQEHPDLILSAAVVPDVDEAIRTKRQNWLAWVQAGWLDLLSPMIYSLDDGHVANEIARMAGNTGSAWLAPGIAPFMGMSAHQVIDQVTASRQAGQPGVVMFALHSIDADDLAAYATGLFKMKAATPWNRSGALSAFAAWVMEGMNRWVAEDLLPSDTALALDEMAYDVASWWESGAQTPIKTEWMDTLRSAKASLESPFYADRSKWLQKQIDLMIDVLLWGQD